MNRRTISVIRHDGQSIRLRSLTRAAADRDRAVGFLALMQSAYPGEAQGDGLWARSDHAVAEISVPFIVA